MKNKKWIILIIIGIIFICLAFSLLVYNKYVDNKAGIESKAALQKIQKNLATQKKLIKTNTINIDGHEYIGIINIPSLELELPVMSKCTEQNMKTSPCRYYGSLETNDLVICAHSYKNLFRYIKNLKSKDILIYTDLSNNVYIYEVELVEILAPEDIEEMLDNKFNLTLYTCTNDNQNRVTVRLNRLDKVD